MAPAVCDPRPFYVAAGGIMVLWLARELAGAASALKVIDRAPDYESGGQEFESLRARQWNQRFLSNIENHPSQNSDLGRSWEGGEVSS
jgi:hypothetical protein